MNNVFITFEYRIPQISAYLRDNNIYEYCFLLKNNLSHKEEPKATDVELVLHLANKGNYKISTGCAIRIKYTNKPKDRPYMYRHGKLTDRTIFSHCECLCH